MVAALNPSTTGDSGFSYAYSVFDVTANLFVIGTNGYLIYGTDITSFDPMNIIAGIQAQIMAWQPGSGYSFTVADISYNGPGVLTPAQAVTAINATQARVFNTPTFASATTAVKLSSTRDAETSYDVDAVLNLTLLSGQSVIATLKYADNSGMSTNVVTVSSQIAASSGVLGLNQTATLKLSGWIPANKYRQVTFAVTGGASAPTTLRAAEEVLS